MQVARSPSRIRLALHPNHAARFNTWSQLVNRRTMASSIPHKVAMTVHEPDGNRSQERELGMVQTQCTKNHARGPKVAWEVLLRQHELCEIPLIVSHIPSIPYVSTV